MGNFFDQFDQQPATQPATQATGGNYFDQFDAQPPVTIRGMYQGVMNNIAKPLNDAVNAGIDKIASLEAPAAQSIASGIDSNSGMGYGGEWVGNSLMNAKNYIAGKIQPVIDNVNDLAQYNPNLKKDLSALGQNAQLLGNLTAAKAPLEAAGNAVSAKVAPIANTVEAASQKLPSILGDVGSGVSPNVATANIPKLATDAVMTPLNIMKAGVTSTGDLNDAAGHWYGIADNSGALLKPQAMQKVVSDIKGKVLGSTPEEQAFGNNSVVDDYLNRLDKISNMPVSIKGLDGIDGKLQDAIGTASRSGDKETVSALKTIQNGLRNASNTASPQDLVNPDGFQAWRNGDAIYAAKMKSQQIDNIVKSAYQTKTPQTAIQTGMGKLAKSIDKYGNQGWSPEEIQAINNAAKTGLVTGALNTMGSRIIAGIGGAVAGGAGGGVFGVPIGIAAAEAATIPMRYGAGALQSAKATQVQRLLGNRPNIKNLMESTPAIEEPKNLIVGGSQSVAEPIKRIGYTEKPTDIVVGQNGTKLLTPAEQEALNNTRDNAASLGSNKTEFTPEQRALLAKIQVAPSSLSPVNAKSATGAATSLLPPPVMQKAVPIIKEFNSSGRPTNLNVFIRKNGGLVDTGGDLASMGYKDLINPKGMSVDKLGELLTERGFFNQRPSVNDVLNFLEEHNGGKTAYAPKDITRIMRAQEAATFAKQNDPSFIEYTASQLGIDTEGKTTKQLLKELTDIERQRQEDIPF